MLTLSMSSAGGATYNQNHYISLFDVGEARAINLQASVFSLEHGILLDTSVSKWIM